MTKAIQWWLCITSLLASLAVADDARPLSIGAYYYPWYDSNGLHWSEGYYGKNKGQQPALGLYSSRAQKTIQQHITWSADLGIDHWICSWWGPGSWEDQTLKNQILPELADNPAAPKFCLLYESAGLLGLSDEHGINFDETGQTAKFAEHFRYLARNYLSHPNYLRIDGKPVIYLYLTRTFSGDYAFALKRARVAAEAQGFELYLVGDEVFWAKPDNIRIQQFDAITSYNMHGPERFADLTDWRPFIEEVEAVYQNYRDVASSHGVNFIPGVMPGFDANHTETIYYPIPRTLSPTDPAWSTLRDTYIFSAFRE